MSSIDICSAKYQLILTKEEHDKLSRACRTLDKIKENQDRIRVKRITDSGKVVRPYISTPYLRLTDIISRTKIIQN